MKALISSLLLVLFSVSAFAQSLEDLPPLYRKLVMFEQIYNDKVENLEVFTTIMQNDMDKKYLPINQPIIPLETIWIPAEEATIMDTTKGKMTPMMLVNRNGKDYVKLLVHPESRDMYAAELAKYEVTHEMLSTPTSSHRSMIAWDKNDPKNPLYVKVSINKKIGNVLRIMTNGQMERAAAVSYMMQTMDMEEYARKGIHFIDEPLHMWMKSNKTGYSIRTMPYVPEGGTLMPMFALYSKKDGSPMLAEMIRRSGQRPHEFLRENIIGPMTSHMMELAFKEGLVGDNHEQNATVLVKNGKLTKQFYYRDLGGFDINVALREAAGKDMSFLPKDFNTKHLKFERADTIGKIMDYLKNSNFFAMRAALEGTPYEVSKEWVNKTVMETLSAEVYLRTGTRTTNPEQLKAALTKYAKRKTSAVMSCSGAFL